MIYLAFNKPFQVMSQFKPMDDKRVLSEFIKLKEMPKAVGRLDFDSEGLLLLSDDIRFIQKMTTPVHEIEKEYYAQVEGTPTLLDLAKFEKGIITESEKYKPAKAELIDEPSFLWERTPPIRFRKSVPTTWIKIILKEGKNRQVRKMTAFIGFPTLRLIRVRIGAISLNGLKPGEYRFLTKKDLF